MKTKSNKKLIAAGLVLVMFALYGVFPLPQGADAADSLKDASQTISDSDMDATGVTHTFEFTLENIISAGGVIDVDVHADFTGILVGNVTCSSAGSASVTGNLITCAYAGGLAADTAMTVTVTDTTNPAVDGDRRSDIETYDEPGKTTLLDRISVMAYVIDDVLMTATVDPILEFTIQGVLAGDSKVVNGIDCQMDTSATSTPFGTLVVNATTTVCQQLNVTTNADDGYIVTVEQDQEMTSDSGSNINSFDNSANDTGSSTEALAHTWLSPNNTLDEYNTYGHMGLTSDDTDLDSVGGGDIDFDGVGVARYVGFNATDPIIIMSHDGPSDGTTQNVGEAFVAYTAEIASLQEAGDYESTLTYIATPTY